MAPMLKLGEKLCFAKFSQIVLKPTLKLGEKLCFAKFSQIVLHQR
jgi:hypothetical protein